jgi:hypothetical protein
MEEYSHRLLALAEEVLVDPTVPGPAPAATPPPWQALRTVPWKKKQKQTESQVAVPPPGRALARLAPPPSPAPAAPVALPPHTGPLPESPRGLREAKLQAQLDQATLDLSITLLEHPLKEDLFKSTLVGFLAVLRVGAARQTFQDPYSYTSSLSGLVKMAQMLVALRAVREADAGHVSHPADALDEMRERFLIYGVRAPFGWIARLRTYGKKIQNSTTSMGYIYWTDDEQTPSFKDLRLSIRGLRKLIARHRVRACYIIIFHNAPVKVGLCPFCLGDEVLGPVRRMQQFLDRAEWYKHIEPHLSAKARSGELNCSHPACRMGARD